MQDSGAGIGDVRTQSLPSGRIPSWAEGQEKDFKTKECHWGSIELDREELQHLRGGEQEEVEEEGERGFEGHQDWGRQGEGIQGKGAYSSLESK